MKSRDPSPPMPGDPPATARTEAPAKVNLTLHIGARRSDGFHELSTVFQAISLSDTIEVTLHGVAEEPATAEGRIDLVVEGADVGPMRDNLAYRAARAFLSETRTDDRVTIRLAKRIPAGAGLGGGSSDAAAVLRCLAALTGHDGVDRLRAIGARIGSDVPFFLGPTPTAIGRGRGEVIDPVDALPERCVALSLPPVHVETAAAYRALAAERVGRTVVELPSLGPELTWASIRGGLGTNDFEQSVSRSHAEVARSLAALHSTDAELVMLSGSGAASFAVFGSDVRGSSGLSHVDRVCRELTDRLGWPVVACTTRATLPAVVLE